MAKQQHRFDEGVSFRVERTPEGYLRGTAPVTRTGIFLYKGADGSIIRELRHPDDVFDRQSMHSLKLLPITNLHPATDDGLVSASTAQALSIGTTGEEVHPDGKFLVSSICITAKAGVDAVDSGREELSLGYTFEMDEQPGVYDGMEYDCRQRNIRYNHLAIVDKGRAGASVRLNHDAAMESTEEECKEEDCTADACGGKRKKSAGDCSGKKIKQNGDCMSKVNLDGIQYEVPPEVERHINKLAADLSDGKKAFDSITGERDGLKDRLAAAEKAASPEALRARIDGRVSLEKIAVDFLDVETQKKIGGMSDVDLRKAVILSKHPTANFDGKSEEYIAGRFDAVVNDKGSSAADQRKTVATDGDGKGTRTADQARAEMINRMKGGK